MSATFTVKLTEQDYLTANRLYYWNAQLSKSNAYVLIIATLALIAFQAYIVHGRCGCVSEQLPKIFGIAVGLTTGLFSLGFIANYLYLPMLTRKLFAQQKLMHYAVDYTVTPSAIESVSEVSSTKLPYAAAFKWLENSATFLIFHSDRTFQIIPKTSIREGILAEIRESLVEHGVAGKTK